jgi:diacylglycerol O-acyltransferase / wax synthase
LSDIKDVMPRDVSWFGAPIVLTALAQMSGQRDLADALPPIVNVLISNVPGPRKEKYCVGAKMLHVYPVSAISHGLALNITLISYLHQLHFGLIACRDSVPDIEKLAGGSLCGLRPALLPPRCAVSRLLTSSRNSNALSSYAIPV